MTDPTPEGLRDDPLIDYLFLAHENWEQHDGPTPDMFTMFAHAVRAYWREQQLTQEGLDHDQIEMLQSRVWELETRGQRVESFWWAFWRALIEQDFHYAEMDCTALVTETAVALGLVTQVPYDPAMHSNVAGDPKPGDLIYVTVLAQRTP